MTQFATDYKIDTDSLQPEPIFISEIKPTNFLSFGPDTEAIELRALNVLIGANGSGKSNLIEAIAFLRAAPTGFQKVTGQGGGVDKWIWQGAPDDDASVYAAVNNAAYEPYLQHTVRFRPNNFAFQLAYEQIEDAVDMKDEGASPFHAINDNGHLEITAEGETETIVSEEADKNTSLLARFRDPERYRQLTYLAEQYGKVSIYRDWRFGRDNVLRASQKADAPELRLEEDYSNLSLFLNYIANNDASRDKFLYYLQEIYQEAQDIKVEITKDGAFVSLIEEDYSISAIRLSDGTLRYLALIAILCDPNPPPLLCIEEPEIGLHTDLLPILARLLLDASQQTQLIVTTHSDILVDALTDYPETVVVCEKHNGQTQMKRLKEDEVSIWLKDEDHDYSLGGLWIDGEIGGKRR